MNENKTLYKGNIDRLEHENIELQHEISETESRIVDFDEKMTWAADHRDVVQNAIEELEGE